MATYVVLLRGINLGGRNRLSMPTLRDVLTADGYSDVRTYVQSGNIVLGTRSGRDVVVASVRRHLRDTFGLEVGVVLRTAAELAEVAASNPFIRPGADPGRHLHVAFLDGVPDKGALAGLDPHRSPPDELAVGKREIYLWCPNGFGRTKVLNGVERILGVSATVRNWRTVTELLGMSGGPSS